MNKSLKFGLSAIALALLAACGGGGSDSSDSTVGYTASGGTVQKGPLVQGSSITVNALSPTTWQPSGDSYTFEITNNLGNFSAAGTVFSTQYADSTALGYYFDELKGVVSKDMVFLRGLSDLSNDKAINLNVLTNITRSRIRALMTRAVSPLSFTDARKQAQRELLEAFKIRNSAVWLPGGTTQPASFSELDLSMARAADQILAAVSGVITQLGQDGSGINAVLSQLEADLADDGLINNSPQYSRSTANRLTNGMKWTNFTTVSENLNKFYGNSKYTSLSVGRWIDSSGGIDGLVDLYKVTNNGSVGVESISTAYTASTDDIGKCFSVSAGRLITSYAVRAVSGSKYQIGLTPQSASNISGFLQRSNPDANGNCTTAIPQTPNPIPGVTRVQKLTVSFSTSPQVSTLHAFDGLGINRMVSDSLGNIYFSIPESNVVIRSSPDGQFYVYGSGVAGDSDGVGTSATFTNPTFIAIDPNGTVYVADGGTSYAKIRKLNAAGTVSTLAGSSRFGDTNGTGSAASFSQFSYHGGIAADAKGNVYISEYYNNKIRKVTPAGVTTTLAGSGSYGFSDGQGEVATFSGPGAIVVAPDGTVYVADSGDDSSCMVRRIDFSGFVSTLAGIPSDSRFEHRNGIGTSARFNEIHSLAVDAAGNIYASEVDSTDYVNTLSFIRKITPNGVVSYFAGAGADGLLDGAALSARFSFKPYWQGASLTFDAAGNLYVLDDGNNTVRKITP